MKKCFTVIDYQTDFVCGSLGFKKAEGIEKPLLERIDFYRKSNADIIFTIDTHNEDFLLTKEGQFIKTEHCLNKSVGQSLYGKIKTQLKETDKCFIKSSFGSADLFAYMQKSNYNYIEIAGLVTNICVLFNAVLIKTALPEAQITINASLCASNDENLHKQTLNILKSSGFEIIGEKL